MESINGVAYPRTGKRGVPQQFPRRLYNMLESESPREDIDNRCGGFISWSQTGKAFRIDDVTLFSTHILPKYFRTNKFSSFQRNLNLYGFSKVRRGPDADMYAHPSFQRGHPELLSELKKCKTAADRKRQAKTLGHDIHAQSAYNTASTVTVTAAEHPFAPSNSVGFLRNVSVSSASSSSMGSVTNRSRPVSPSSSSEDGSLRNAVFPAHTYAPQFDTPPRQQNSYHLTPSAATQNLPQTHAHQIDTAPPSPPAMGRKPNSPPGSSKLGLLTLAMTCLAADANLSSQTSS